MIFARAGVGLVARWCGCCCSTKWSRSPANAWPIVHGLLEVADDRPAGGIAGDGWPGWRARRDRGHSSLALRPRDSFWSTGSSAGFRMPRICRTCLRRCLRTGLRLVPGPTWNHWISRRPATFARCWRSSREGPDHLIGFSYGAHLAYQVACKLAAAQQSVGLLALVDAAPGFERTEPMAGEHLIRGDMRIARPELDHRAYAHVPARILYFRSSFRFESSFLLPGGGWEELALGGVETVRITGGHLGTVVDPVAAAIGRIVREALGGPAAAPSPQVLHRELVEHTGTESSWRIAARRLARTGDLPGQLELYRRALSRNPQQPAWVIVNFARLCDALDRTELLDPIAAWLTGRCTADARFAYAMAIVHSVCGRRSLAAAAFRQSAHLEHHDPAPFVRLAREANCTAEQEEAIRAAMAKAPTDPALRVHLAEGLMNHDRFAAALELLHEATAMPGSDDWIEEQRRDAEARWRQRQEYDRLVERVCRLVSSSTPDGTTTLVISKGDPGFLAVDGRTARHFPCDATGEYRGYYPADSREAVNDLEHLRKENATYLVVPRSLALVARSLRRFPAAPAHALPAPGRRRELPESSICGRRRLERLRQSLGVETAAGIHPRRCLRLRRRGDLGNLCASLLENELLIPPPSSVLRTFWTLASSGELNQHFAATLMEFVCGFRHRLRRRHHPWLLDGNVSMVR